LCATRGELAAALKPPSQKKREIHYALHLHGEKVFLAQRSRKVSLMAGMWELPELTSVHNDSKPLFTLRHSITVTDYTVRVWTATTPPGAGGKWIPAGRLSRMALTGLARKILRKAALL
jgi:adenine-specific DNA glycosylase